MNCILYYVFTQLKKWKVQMLCKWCIIIQQGKCKLHWLIFGRLRIPHKFLKSSNGHSWYFFKCHYCNLWLINVQSPKIPHKLANLSLGGTTKNVTPQIFETHPTSKQHRIHIKKTFHSKLFIKRLPKLCRTQNSN